MSEIADRLDAVAHGRAEAATAAELLQLGEEILEQWVTLEKGVAPTDGLREGFRILALHRQGAEADPSFNACRETCRELVYHFNLLTMQPDHPDRDRRMKMMAMVANHLYLFISGKLESRQLGEFCCSSKPLRLVQ